MYIYLAIVICMFSVMKIKKKKRSSLTLWQKGDFQKKRRWYRSMHLEKPKLTPPHLSDAFETVPMFETVPTVPVFFLTDNSHPFNATCLVLPLSVPLSPRWWMVEGTLPRLHTTRFVMWLWWRKALVKVWQRGWKHFAKWLCAYLSMLFTYSTPSGFVLY